MTNALKANPYEQLKAQIGELLRKGREQAGRAVNAILVQTYWQIGRYIVEYEQKGNVKAEYGSELLDRLSKDLTAEFGRDSAAPIFSRLGNFISSFQKSRHCLDN